MDVPTKKHFKTYNKNLGRILLCIILLVTINNFNRQWLFNTSLLATAFEFAKLTCFCVPIGPKYVGLLLGHLICKKGGNHFITRCTQKFYMITLSPEWNINIKRKKAWLATWPISGFRPSFDWDAKSNSLFLLYYYLD